MQVVSLSTRGKVRVCLLSTGFMVLFVFCIMMYAPLAQAGATTTTLGLSSSSVIFTATVSNGAAVTTGVVSFCDATAAYCENPSVVIGTAQLTSAGTAVIKLVPGLGTDSYKAIFNGTKANGASTSSTQALMVTGAYSTTTAISKLGSAGSSTLRATVVDTGSTTPSMTGSVSFVDTTNGNFVLSSVVIGSRNSSQVFGTQVPYAVAANPISIAIGDFNGDGLADLAVVNSGSNTVSVLLSSGTQTAIPTVSGASQELSRSSFALRTFPPFASRLKPLSQNRQAERGGRHRAVNTGPQLCAWEHPCARHASDFGCPHPALTLTGAPWS